MLIRANGLDHSLAFSRLHGPKATVRTDVRGCNPDPRMTFVNIWTMALIFTTAWRSSRSCVC